MRLFSYILSFYFAILSFVPCADRQQKVETSESISEIVQTPDHDHSDHEDNCTSICFCACCGTTITLASQTNLVFKTTNIAPVKILLYHFNYSFIFNEGIWHPPASKLDHI